MDKNLRVMADVIKFEDYDVFGFDIDNTLAKYNIPNLFEVSDIMLNSPVFGYRMLAACLRASAVSVEHVNCLSAVASHLKRRALKDKNPISIHI